MARQNLTVVTFDGSPSIPTAYTTVHNFRFFPLILPLNYSGERKLGYIRPFSLFTYSHIRNKMVSTV